MKPRKPIARTTRPKARNPVRRVKEFARAYFSKARVKFVQNLPCCACGETRWGCDNAHTPHESAGMGHKADYTAIIPLCSGPNGCHAKQHALGWFAIGMSQIGRERAAENTEAMWQDYRNRGTDDDEG